MSVNVISGWSANEIGDSHGVAAAKWKTIGSDGSGVSVEVPARDVELSECSFDRRPEPPPPTGSAADSRDDVDDDDGRARRRLDPPPPPPLLVSPRDPRPSDGSAGTVSAATSRRFPPAVMAVEAEPFCPRSLSISWALSTCRYSSWSGTELNRDIDRPPPESSRPSPAASGARCVSTS